MVYTVSGIVPSEEAINGADLPKVTCIVHDITNPTWQAGKFSITLPGTTFEDDLYSEVGRQANYESGTYTLIWKRGGKSSQTEIEVSCERRFTLEEMGMLKEKNSFFELRDKDGVQPTPLESVGAEGGIPMQQFGPIQRSETEVDGGGDSSTTAHEFPLSYASVVTKDTIFVGLVNQAMTCYLNSLLQTLFMTPEFRNALYRWEYDEKMADDPIRSSKNIPHQLQRLFVQLQTSVKRSVETTDVTRSFGWDSSEAWQQHDVQELCRVMFDALEQKWKNTGQRDLINQLYQGLMKDYVKCLECGYESARKDAFLDIPLVIRPFGEDKAYGSVEEALRAFVTPETLDGSNQYFCEKCNKKCDAHKGLKFVKFPYLLTLQLKRFDFDYTTLQRIKLNDRMTFPEVLDLNSLVDKDELSDKMNKDESESQSDSGAENEDSDPSNQNSDITDDVIDEGIDVENSASGILDDSGNESQKKGPFRYRLFSIMVHSGTASGGHYYAYICNFDDNLWYCFNDQQVTRCTYDDIRKTYGGSSSSYGGYYFSAYSSSTNAYMLMYRQIDEQRNAQFLSRAEFPQHIQRLMDRIQTEEEDEKKAREIERNTCKIKLFGIHPITDKLIEAKLEVHKDRTLVEAAAIAHRTLGFQDVIPVEQCRLVKYDEFHENIERSYEGEEESPMGSILNGIKTSYMFDLFLETRKAEEEFETYKPGGATLKVFVVDIKNQIVNSPIRTRVCLSKTIKDLKQHIAKLIPGLDPAKVRLVLEKYYNDLKLLTASNKSLKAEGFNKSNKIFVECSSLSEEDQEVSFAESQLYKLLDRQANTIRLFVNLPPKPTGYSPDSREGSLSSSASNDSVQNVTDNLADMHLDCANLSPTNLPTPSPTGSSSTLSDDHPLEKSSFNLLGSETDSGVVSLNEARLCDDPKGLEHEENPKSATECENCQNCEKESELRGNPDGSPSVSEDTRNIKNQDRTLPECKCQDSVETQTCMSCLSQRHVDRQHLTLPLTSPVKERWPPDEDDSSGQSAQVDSDPGSTSSSSNKLPLQESGSDDSRTLYQDSETGTDVVNSEGSATVTEETEDWDAELASESYLPAPKVREWYFKEEEIEEEDGKRVMPVYLDKRMTLGFFKKSLEPFVGVSTENFKIFRVYANSQEFESVRLSETLVSYNEDSHVVVKHGRALKRGEYRVKIFLLSPNHPEDSCLLSSANIHEAKNLVQYFLNKCNFLPCKFLFDWVFAKGMTVLESKKELLPEICAKCGVEVSLDRIRLRQKVWKNPGGVYLDDRIYDEDIPLFTSWESFIEILDEPETLESSSQLLLFTRRWRPSELKLDPFDEVVLSDATVSELKKALAEKSSIPEENIEIAKGRGTFPCEISVLDMQTDLDWDPNVKTLSEWPLYINDDGAVVYYRDKDEEVKGLTEEQKNDLKKKESERLGSTPSRPVYTSPKKEKALKIFIDMPNES